MAKTRGEQEGSRREGPGLVEQLREAIRGSGLSLNQLSRECSVGRDRLSRFLRGDRDLTVAAAEQICRALHLGLSPLPGEPPARKVRPQPGGETGQPEASGEKPGKRRGKRKES
jgi:transcriptional regulator with XRE-family HTH domain